MKKYAAIALLAATLTACEEKTIVIPELSVGDRIVLIEELTGVNCPNCPDGAIELLSLQEVYGKENLAIVSIHSALTGSFSNLLPPSRYDFRTAEIDDLVGGIGAVEQVPSAAINRAAKAGETSLFLSRTDWNAVLANQISQEPQIGVFLETTYDNATRNLNIKINLAPDATLNGEHRISVYLTQDSIVDAQNIEGFIEPNYMHRHILRDVVSSTSGDLIGEALTGGALVQKNYQVTLPADYDTKHCSVVAFVHRGSGFNNKEVLQAVEKHVLD